MLDLLRPPIAHMKQFNAQKSAAKKKEFHCFQTWTSCEATKEEAGRRVRLLFSDHKEMASMVNAIMKTDAGFEDLHM